MKKILFFLLLSFSSYAQTIDLGAYYNNVRGDDSFSKTTGAISSTANSPSGFRQVNDQANTPFAAGWPFHNIRVRVPGVYDNSLTWSWDLSAHYKTGAFYENFYDAQVGAWQGYKRVHSNRWFPVSETLTPASFDQLTYNSTTSQWENKSITTILNRKSITEFGAIASDGVDDTQAIRNALNARIPLWVPEGLFEVNDSLPVINNGSLDIRGQSLNSVIKINADKNLFVFTSNAGAGGTVMIDNLTLQAGVNMTFGTAIKLRLGLQRKTGGITNVQITRPDGTKEFKYGVTVENPNEFILRDIVISGNNTTKLIGVNITGTQAAISPTFTNIKVYDANTGFNLVSSTTPGIEGIKFEGCDAVGVGTGFSVVSTVSPATYVPPGINMHNCHVNANVNCMILTNYVQSDIHNNIFYYFGTTAGTGIAATNTSDLSITTNKFYTVSTGSLYPITVAGTPTNGTIALNTFTLKAGDNTAGIVINNGVTNFKLLYNERLSGGLSDYINSSGTTITIIDKYSIPVTGTAVLSGAATTVYSFPHGLGVVPSYYIVTPTSANASQQFYTTVDATNITVNYITAPTTGTSNLKYNYAVRR